MPLELTPRNSVEEIHHELVRAAEDAHQCDSVLIIMQKKSGGLLYYAPPNLRVETLSFMASTFLSHLHQIIRE